MIEKKAGTFAENKDVAKEVREYIIKPNLEKGDDIVLDFKNVDSSTQSFIHALLSEIFQNLGEVALERFEFRNCNKAVKSIIGTVINYSLE